MKLAKMMRVAAVGLLALGLVALAGCGVQGGTGDATPKNASEPAADANANDNGEAPAGDVVSTAMVAGNIVQVTGNGIMLESYPGQYPGISKVEVIEQGNPADAEQYADIVDTVFAAPDQSQVPSGNLDYKTADAQLSDKQDPNQ